MVGGMTSINSTKPMECITSAFKRSLSRRRTKKHNSIRNDNYSNKIQTKKCYNKKRETFQENKKNYGKEQSETFMKGKETIPSE